MKVIPKNRNPILVVLALLVVICGVSLNIPIGITILEPSDEVLRVISKDSSGRVLFLSSFDDFYENQLNQWKRRVTSAAIAEEGRDEIISAASLGDVFFNNFLNSHNIGFVVVPLKSASLGQIRYKWGKFGSVNIELKKPYFEAVTGSAGDFPTVLYKVGSEVKSDYSTKIESQYSLTWDESIRSSFYQPQSRVEKDGLYNYKYTNGYENDLGVNWVYGYPTSYSGVESKTEYMQFQYRSSAEQLSSVSVSIILVAAYGPNAPDQVVRVSSNGVVTAHVLTASQPVRITLSVNSGDSIQIKNALPCRQPRFFQPDDSDLREYCFGVADIQIRPQFITS
jgi:hypothetical protein